MPKGVKFPWGNFDGCQLDEMLTPQPPFLRAAPSTPPFDNCQTVFDNVAAASQILTSNWHFD